MLHNMEAFREKETLIILGLSAAHNICQQTFVVLGLSAARERVRAKFIIKDKHLYE